MSANSPQDDKESKEEATVICYYCNKSFPSPTTGSEAEGMIVNCPHCGKQTRLGKTMTGRNWVLRQFAILGVFALLGIVGILIWIYGTIERTPMTWLGLGGSIFLVAVFVFSIVLTIYRLARYRSKSNNIQHPFSSFSS